MNIIAEARANEYFTVTIRANHHGWFVINRLEAVAADPNWNPGDGVWDGRIFSSESKARAAANQEWARLRKVVRENRWNGNEWVAV